VAFNLLLIKFIGYFHPNVSKSYIFVLAELTHMKRLYILLLLIPILVSSQTNYVSQSDGDWSNPATWNPHGIPAYPDNVTISNNVTISASTVFINNVTINSGGILNNTKPVGVYGLITNNSGGIWKGNGIIDFDNTGLNVTIITGGGDFSGQTGTWYFCGSPSGTATYSITSSVKLVKNGGDLIIYTPSYNKSIRILNFGSVTMTSGQLRNGGTFADSWTQESGSTLSVANAMLTNSYDTLVASGNGNIVEYGANTNFTIKAPKNNTYYHLYIANGTKQLPASTTISGEFQLEAPDANLNMAGFNITIGGDWINNSAGTISNNTGTVFFNGSALQTIGGIKSTRFANMTLSGTGGVNLAKSISFTGTLSLTSTGNLSANAGIYDTLISKSASTGRIAQISTSATISANFVVQRYESGRGTLGQYAALSTPFGPTETVGDWNTSNQTSPNIFYMSINGGANGLAYYSNGSPYYSVYNYVESNPSANFAEYVPIQNAGTTIPQGEGIYLWLGTSTTAMVDPFTYIQHGVPSVGTLTLTVSLTPGGQNGVNLLGNPYASTISWAQFQLDNPGLKLQGQYYLMESSGSWVSSAANPIAMCQGFCVVIGASGAPTTFNALFQEDQKTPSNPNLLRQQIPDPNQVTFVLSDNANTYSCPATVAFDSRYIKDYNSAEDAYFIPSLTQGVPILYTGTKRNENIQFNAQPDTDQILDIPLIAMGNVAALHTITVQNIDNLNSYNSVSLIDATTGQEVANFENNPSYSFNISEPGQEKDFILRFSKLIPYNSSAYAANNVTIYSSEAGATISFNLNQAENTQISVMNITGQIVKELQTNAYKNNLQLDLPSGIIYIVKVITPEGITINKLYH
jgi:hypothetical protein